jgi:hypothetical protein
MLARYGLYLRLTRPIILLGIVLAYALILSCLYRDVGIRSIAGYLSAFVIAWASYLIHQHGLFKVSLIKKVLWIWTAIGIIQLLFAADFGRWVLPDMRTTEGRGVISLAPEPSYYGAVCILIFVLIRMLRAKAYVDDKFCRSCNYLLLFQIVVLAKSPMSILILLLYVVINQVVNFKFRNLITAMILVCVGSFASFYFFPESRMVSLAKLLREDPRFFYITDASINDRLSHIVISLSGFIDSLPYGVGYGTNAWSDYLFHNARNFPDFPYMFDASRIMCAFGGALFELGYIGLILPFVVLYSFLSQKEKEMKTVGLFLCAFMFQAVPLAFPLFGFTIGLSEAMRVARNDRLQRPCEQKSRRLFPKVAIRFPGSISVRHGRPTTAD